MEEIGIVYGPCQRPSWHNFVIGMLVKWIMIPTVNMLVNLLGVLPSYADSNCHGLYYSPKVPREVSSFNAS